jgi:hypothetical protein
VAGSTPITAVAVPPSPAAAVKAVRVIPPAAGTGATEVRARSTTVLSASVAEIVREAPKPWRVVSAPPQVMTIGSSAPTVWVPRFAISCSIVVFAKPSHSTAGSNASEPFESPTVTVFLRRRLLSIVLVRPLPHSFTGRTPIWPMTSTFTPPLRRATASSPLNQPALLDEFCASALTASSAPEWAITYVPCAGTVPVRLIVNPTDEEPLKYI